jgi:hypothetical protein
MKKGAADKIAVGWHRRVAAEDKIPAIYAMMEQRGLKAAQQEYVKTFGSYQDKQIGIEIDRAFSEWLNQDEGWRPLRIPPRLILALLLREGFAGRSRGPVKRVGSDLAVAAWAWYRRERDQCLKAGLPQDEAERKASKRISARFGLSAEAMNEIIERRRYRKRGRPK